MTTKSEMVIVQGTQNNIMRVLSGLKEVDTHTSVLLDETGFLSVYQLSFYAVVSQVHRALLTKQPEWLTRQLVWCPPSRTGEAGLKPQRFKNNLRGECLAVKGIRAYNLLPLSLVSLPLHSFKRGAKEWIKVEVPIKPP